jgi:hypothetical protein
MDLLVVAAIRLLEGMFVVGGIGSIVVLVLSGIEDVAILFGSAEQEH